MTEVSNPEQRVELIKARLQEALEPTELNIVDDSHLHEGHEGAQESGGGHYNIQVVSNHFTDKSAIERHRMIYMALGDAMGTDIHALSINAQTPEEASTSQTSE